jgi:NAD(P)H-flavin reductase/ferredoxin
VSGAVLLWLVYASGINGYMLPWDRFAQFTVVATAEWLDWLPVFNGALIRNFIFQGAVNDRLFSLLSFIHIGGPLFAFAVLWVHTQRVPRAKTTPPAGIVAWLSLSLLMLAAVKPAVSQEPANLSTVPGQLAFDWFYLPVYPLIYRWSPGELWALVGAATLLFFLLPWLPPRLRRLQQGPHLLFHPDNHIVAAREGETILDAGLREGLPLPFECRNGGCGVCKCTVLYGDVELGAYQDSALTEEERAAGKALMCSATPKGDIELEYVPVGDASAIPVAVYEARVQSMRRLSDDVMLLELQLTGGGKLRFYAGQYINILLPDGQKRSFSFATAPHEDDHIELQVRLVPGGLFTTQVFTAMKEGDTLRFEGPLGSFFLREDSDKPIIFVAGATGFAPVKSMIEHAFHIGLAREIVLYWGVRSRKDLYLAELPEQWAREHVNFHFVPVLSEPRSDDHWQGRTGLVHEAILQDYPDLAGHQLYACGSVKMVETAHPAFRARGLAQDDCFSDAFRLAPQLKVQGAHAEAIRLGGRA